MGQSMPHPGDVYSPVGSMPSENPNDDTPTRRVPPGFAVAPGVVGVELPEHAAPARTTAMAPATTPNRRPRITFPLRPDCDRFQVVNIVVSPVVKAVDTLGGPCDDRLPHVGPHPREHRA